MLRYGRYAIGGLPFLGVTTIGAHQSVGSVTGAMMFCSCNRSSSALSLSRKGIVRGRPNAKGFGIIGVMSRQDVMALGDLKR